MRAAEGCLALLCAAAGLWAQQQPIAAQEIERAQQLLNSNLWVDKAWGAYFAGRLHSKDVDRLLIEQFRLSSSLRDSPSYSEARAFVAALFDAAIESGITVPAALLEPYERDWPDAVVILLARDRESNEAEDALMRFRVEESRNSLWLAANNLLFERKSERWYAELLREIQITHRFSLGGDSFGGAPFMNGGGAAGVRMPGGYPPIALYTLQTMPQVGSTLFARGPEDVYYARSVIRPDELGGYASAGPVLRDVGAIRVGYLALLASRQPEATEKLFHAMTFLTYTGPEEFSKAVDRCLDEQEQGIRELLQAIEATALKTPGVRLRIVPTIIDDAQSPHAPLPPVEPRDIDLP